MLTEEQKGVIERLPDEGSLSYTHGGRGMAFSHVDIAEAISLSFKDKTPPQKKRAVIMVGPPGVGKTHTARNLYEQLSEAEQAGTIYVADNEGGAEDNFQPFMDAFHAATDKGQKLEVANRFAPVTRRITSDTLKKALREEYSLIIDISGIGHDANELKLNLRKTGYDDIEVMAIHARFDVTKDRAITDRIWPSDSFNIVSRRIAALESLPIHSEQCNKFTFHSNNLMIDARHIFTISKGMIPLIQDMSGLQQACDDLTGDIPDIRHHLKELKRDRAYRTLVDVDDMMASYDRAMHGAIAFLQDVKKTGVVAAPENMLRRVLVAG